MKKITVSILAALASFVLAGSLFAAGDIDTSSGYGEMDEPAQQMSNIPSADQMMGMKVVSQQGEEIGEIKNLKIDPQTGEISHVTVAKGGLLGMGTEKIAVPLGALSFSLDEATLAVDKSLLDNAPKQANMSDEEFDLELQEHYGISPAWQMEQPDQ